MVPFSGTEQSILLSSPNGYEHKLLLNDKWFGHGVCSGDIDNDGDLDVFFTSPTNTPYLLINDGKGNFTNYPQRVKFSLAGVYSCEMHDVNKDGFIDLVVGGHNYSSNPTNSPAKILWGNGIDFDDDRSTLLPLIDDWGITNDFNFEDIDGDGKEELILSLLRNDFSGLRVQILKNIGNYSYKDITDNIIQDYLYPNENCIVWIRTEDIDKNGKLDIFDSDKSHGNRGYPFRWEQDVDGIFKRKYN